MDTMKSMVVNRSIVTNWKIVYPIFIIKIIFFYYLVGVTGGQCYVGILTLSIFAILFEGLSRKDSRRRKVLFLSLYIIITAIMLIDAIYYSYFAQYSSVNQLFQLDSLFVTTDEVNVASAIAIPISVLLVLDLPLVYYYFVKASKEKTAQMQVKSKKLIVMGAVAAAAIFFVIGINPLDNESLRSINHMEIFTYHINDLVKNTKGSVKRALLDKKTIKQDIKDNVPKSTTDLYHSIGEDKNLIVIQMESFQNFPIGMKYNKQEITPNINKLIKGDSIYFPNYYQTIGKGNTSDAEFATLNSFYPVIERESYRRYVDNTFNGLPWLMRKEGYESLAFHGYKKDFWNREEAYKGQGFETFYSEEKFVMTEKSGFGLTDKEMFKQAVVILKEKEKPTFSFMISLTNHIPYQLDSSLTSLELLDKDKDSMFGHYLQSVRYADEAIGELIQLLKDNDMYDNTVIAMYGDHHGLNCETNEIKERMTEFLGRTYDYDEMLNIPLIIHLPNSGIVETIDTVGGQVDFLPTIANIMGIDIPQPYIFGKDLVNSKDGFVASVTYLLEGSFIKNNTMYQIGRDGSFSRGRAFSIIDGKERPLTGLEKYQIRASTLVQTSKKVLDYDLMKDYIKR